MFKRMLFLSIFTILLAACVCQPPPNHNLTVTLRPQENNKWCWAASGQMVMEFLGNNVNQCTQANNRFNRNDCCNTPTPAGCINSGWPEFNKYNFTFNKTNDAGLSWDYIQNQIFCKRKDFAFTWAWNGGGGHMMAAIGYQTQGGTTFVEVNDPWPPNVGNFSVITYNAYVSGAGYTHWDDYYDVTPIGD
jgi:hypothetical protein